MKTNIIYILATALALSLPWLGCGGYTLFVAFVPLLLLQKKCQQLRAEGTKCRFIPWCAAAFFLWQLATTFWIMHATFGGMLAAVAINTLLTTAIFSLYHKIWLKAPKSLSYTMFTALWLMYEYIYLHGEISWPWTTLGFGFGNSTAIVQWFEYSGTLGGSLWVLVANLLIFELITNRTIGKQIVTAVWIAAPIALSLIMLGSYKDDGNRTIDVHVIQPNIDPYNEKFGGLTAYQQLDIILTEAAKAPAETDYFLAPETAIERIWENEINSATPINTIRTFLKNRYPGAEFITGAATHYKYAQNETPSITARYSRRLEHWYDNYNSALKIDTTQDISVYHKSRLVPGVEMMPYPKFMKFLENNFLNLGGMYGQLGTQPDREVFVSNDSTRTATAICYESIYGDYLGEFIRNGAQVLFIVTNDGWWKNTPGYRQHFSFARLRAIEFRRWVARSANTGISGVISPTGEVIKSAGWDSCTSLSHTLTLNNKITVYALYGDSVGRCAMFIAILGLLYFAAYTTKKKSHLVN